MNTPAAPAQQPVNAPTKRGLFLGFLMVGLQGFGGVLPFARRMLVEQHRWLTEREFNEVLSLSQFLPGPNIVNVSVIVGNRYRGPLGSVAVILAALYARFADLEAVRGATSGVSAAATGLIIATGLKMAQALKGIPWQIVMCALTFIAIALLRLPLLWVLAVLAPISIAIAWRTIPR
ncbi:MAG: chromate transporter [Betaproteobacteria bacterium]|nr:MAG: chromate transporter [Betaproteobacteria bacterium]